jgi:hypothetical protein
MDEINYLSGEFAEDFLRGQADQADAVKSLKEQYAGRLKLRAHDLISEAHGLLQRVDAGPGNYFDTIAQRQLMKSIALRVNDAAMLALIEAWLEIAIEASDGNGKKPRSSNHC